MRPFVYATVALLAFSTFVGSADAEVRFDTLAGYRQVGTFYEEGYGGDPPLHGLDIGTQSASLHFDGPGPYDFSTFRFDGSASASTGALKAASSIEFSGYLVGSYVGQSYEYGIGPVHLIPAGVARAEVTDQIMFSGPPGFYSLQFNYAISGETHVEFQHIHSSASTQFGIVPSVTLGGFFGQHVSDSVVTDAIGIYDSTASLEVFALPGVWYEFTQSLIVSTLIADSYYSTDNDPFQDGDFDPAHILYRAPIVAEHPYSADWGADFSHSMVLQSVVIRDSSGAIAPGVQLISANGVIYPGLSAVPEPSTLAMLAGLAVTGLSLRRTRCWRSRRR